MLVTTIVPYCVGRMEPSQERVRCRYHFLTTLGGRSCACVCVFSVGLTCIVRFRYPCSGIPVTSCIGTKRKHLCQTLKRMSPPGETVGPGARQNLISSLFSPVSVARPKGKQHSETRRELFKSRCIPSHFIGLTPFWICFSETVMVPCKYESAYYT